MKSALSWSGSGCPFGTAGFRVGRIPEVCAFAPEANQVLIFQLFEVVREGAGGYPQLLADLTDDHPRGMGAEEQPDDAQPWFCSHGRKHIGIARDQFRIILLRHWPLPWVYFDDSRNIENVKAADHATGVNSFLSRAALSFS